MATFTVHFSKNADPSRIDDEALANAVLIKDGFSYRAFAFNFLWFFWNRLWLAGLAVLGGLIVLDVLLDVFHVNHFFSFLASVLYMVLIGFEANSLKRWTFGRNGRPVASIVAGKDEIEAEAKMLVLGLSHKDHHRPHSTPHPAPKSPFTPSGATPSALGLFPVSERSR